MQWSLLFLHEALGLLAPAVRGLMEEAEVVEVLFGRSGVLVIAGAYKKQEKSCHVTFFFSCSFLSRS